MTQTTRNLHYPSTIITLHWLTFLLVVVAYAAIEFREIFERGSASREFMKATHYSIGLTILGLTAARILLRLLGSPSPAIIPPPARLQALAGKAMHVTLYAFLIAMPLIGWSILSTEGDPIGFFGLSVPPLLGRDKILSGQLEEVHEVLGNVGYGLIGLHALAAIVHHRIMKDNTLVRIMPSGTIMPSRTSTPNRTPAA